MIRHQLEFTTPSDCEIRFTRSFDAPRALVFRCLSEPDLVRRWLLGPPGWTMPVCEIDFRVGGRFRYVWQMAGGPEMGMGGVYREITPPARIVHNEQFDMDWTGGETLATTTLDETGGRTDMTLVVVYASKAARDGALQSGMVDGMTHGYGRLDALLATFASTGAA